MLKITVLYALIFKPQIDTSKIDDFRQKYDPQAKLITPHITIVFPISEKSIKKEDLIDHIKKALQNEKSFEIHLSGLDKSWDHWLTLVIEEGNEKIIKLHDKLYTGILSPFFRKDIEYIPHIGLGLFLQQEEKYKVTDPTLQKLDEIKYEKALKEAQLLQLNYYVKVDNIELITINDDVTSIVESRLFKFPLS